MIPAKTRILVCLGLLVILAIAVRKSRASLGEGHRLTPIQETLPPRRDDPDPAPKPAYLHGTCTINHRTPEAAARCRRTY